MIKTLIIWQFPFSKPLIVLRIHIDRKHQHLFLLLLIWILNYLIFWCLQSLPFQGFQGSYSTAMLSMFHFWVNTTASFRRDGIASVVGTHWLPPQLPFFCQQELNVFLVNYFSTIALQPYFWQRLTPIPGLPKWCQQ